MEAILATNINKSIQFILQVIAYFNSKLDAVNEKKDRLLSVHEVQDVIRQTAMQFPREKLTVSQDDLVQSSVVQLSVVQFSVVQLSGHQKIPI